MSLLRVPETMERGDQRSRSSSSSSDSGRDSRRKPAARYNAPADDDEDVEKQKKSKASKAVKEYKHTSAYFNFMQDFRAQNAQKKFNVVEMARRGGEAWGRLSKDERRPYETAAEVNRKRQHGKRKRGAGRVEKARKAAKPRKRKAARRNVDADSDFDDRD